MKSKSTKNPVMVRLMENVVDRIPILESGTYNRQDPTHFERGKKRFQIGNHEFTVWFNDCTWGVEITLSIHRVEPWEKYWNEETQELKRRPTKRFQHQYTDKGLEFEIEIADFYFTGDWGPRNEVIIRYKQKGALKILHQIVKNYPSTRPTEEEMMAYEEDPYGCLSDYE